ncbi:MAG TPA: homoserine dehydrogenase [Terriglobales bacterium]|nr:homoserine dehydrogenase [Terriglobales bacterium]
MSTLPDSEIMTESSLRPCNVAILGFGNVGRSVADILCHRVSPRLRLTHIFNRGVGRKRVSWMPPHVHWTEDIEDIVSSDADIVVEVLGGLDPAEQWIRRLLESGKSVVTANKQLIAKSGPELQELAQKHGQQLEFGASVAGGIPVLLALQQGLAGDVIFKVTGILNGTCNYILTKMEAAGATFETALAEAQQFGFAEADPTDDVEGYDARAKLAILARVGLHAQIRPEDISCASIRPLGAADFVYATKLDCTIRQVSRAEVEGRHVVAAVEPALVPVSSPLARVQGSQNLVIATGKYGGETVLAGHGAGGHPTAVAVVSDVIAIARARSEDEGFFHHRRITPSKITDDFTAPRYVRFVVKDRPGIIARLSGTFAKHAINIDSVLQYPGYPKNELPFVITLEACGKSLLQEALAEIKDEDFHVQPPLALPILR